MNDKKPTYEELEQQVAELRKKLEHVETTIDRQPVNNETGRDNEEQFVLEEDVRYRWLFDNEPIALVLADVETRRFIDVNIAACRLFGYSREEFLKLSITDISAEPEASMNTLASQLPGKVLNIPLRLCRKKDETVFPVELSLILFTMDGRLTTYGVFVDITERVKSEEALEQKNNQLRTSEELFSKAFHASPIPMDIIDITNSRRLDVNNAFLRRMGGDRNIYLDLDGLKGINWTDPGEKQIYFGLLKKQGFVSEYPIEVVNMAGQVIKVLASTTTIEIDGVQLAIGAFVDITEQENVLRRLAASEEKVRAILNASTDIIHLIDSEGVILETNTAFSRTSDGEVKSLLMGTNVFDYFHDEAKEFRKSAVMKVFQSGEAYTITDEQSQGKVFQSTIYPVKNEEGKVTAVAVYARNITDQRKAEKEKEHIQAQLLQSQKMEAIGHLAGGVAHDFNNMLAIILSSTDLLKSEISLDDPKYEELKAISQSVERAKDLTFKLLTFARKEKLRNETVKINELITTTLGILERTLDKIIHIKTVFKNNSVIKCDPNQIIQVLINLSNNAADAMPEGGQLTIECSNMKFEDDRCGTCGKKFKGEYCLIQVSDTGTGIARENLDKILEPFFTTKGVGKGTGLGMAITHGIIEGHHGHLHIYSEEGVGTCVKIYLPLSTISREEIKEAEQKNLGGDETVLIVDDEVALGILCRKLLRKYGYTPILSNCGKEAIQLYKDNKNKIDVVILDMVMPDMDGRQVWRALQEINPDVKVIISSGYSINGHAGDLMKEGVKGFVQKPFEQNQMFKVIRDAMDKE